MLKLMYITNQPELAQIAEAAGVDRIFVDMEWIGKAERQRGRDAVLSHHTIADVERIRETLHHAELLVRCNPLHPAGNGMPGTKEEIDQAVSAGADLIMLPYFFTAREPAEFLDLVAGRAKTVLLLETAEAAEHVEELLCLPGLDEMYIGLNDLSLSMGKNFLFEPLTDGTVVRICHRIQERGIPFGFGGIAVPGQGAVPAEQIICEHYRLGSSRVILSRSFYRPGKTLDLEEATAAFQNGVKAIRRTEEECQIHSKFFSDNLCMLKQSIRKAAVTS